MNELTEAERATLRRRGVIKNVAIVFLVIMLILTFFSQAIMRYSLPEVATATVEPGTVSPQIRGSGVVEADEPYELTVKETRTISSVVAKVGEHVDAGGVIYYLEGSESPELKEAQEKLDEMNQEYQLALLNGTFDDETIAWVKSGGVTTFEQFQARLSAATKTVDDLEESIRNVEDQLQQIETADDLTAAQYKYDSATDKYVDAEIALRISEMDYQTSVNNDEIDSLSDEISNLRTSLREIEDEMKLVKEGSKKYEKLMDRYVETQRVMASKEARKHELQSQIDGFKREKLELTLYKAQQAHDRSQLETQNDQVSTHYSQEEIVLKEKKSNLETDLKRAEEAREKAIDAIGLERELRDTLTKIAEQEKTVAELKEVVLGKEITSPIAGTITDVRKAAGQSTSPGEVVAVLQADGKGMVVSFSVANDQARNLKVGDKAEPQNAWYYKEPFAATLKSIVADSNSPTTKKKLTFSIISAEVQAGQNLGLSIGQRSERYDLTVPSSAIHEDTNGKYILIIRVKSSPLGNRYLASRVSVDVLNSDDTTSAISGSLEGYEYVITASTTTVESGAQVRLASGS